MESNMTQSVNLEGCESDRSSSATTLPSFEMNLLQQSNGATSGILDTTSKVQRREKSQLKENLDSPNQRRKSNIFNINDVNIDEMYRNWKSSPSTFNFSKSRPSIADIKSTCSKPVGALSQFIGNRRSMNVEEIGSIEACLNAVGLKYDDFLSPRLKRPSAEGFSGTDQSGEKFTEIPLNLGKGNSEFLNYSITDPTFQSTLYKPDLPADTLNNSSGPYNAYFYNLDNSRLYDYEDGSTLANDNAINSWIQLQGEPATQQSSSAMHAWTSEDASMSSVSITENVSVVAAGSKKAAINSDDAKSSMCSSSDNSNHSAGVKSQSSSTRIRPNHFEPNSTSTAKETGFLMNKGGMMLWQKVQNFVVVGTGLVNSNVQQTKQPK